MARISRSSCSSTSCAIVMPDILLIRSTYHFTFASIYLRCRCGRRKLSLLQTLVRPHVNRLLDFCCVLIVVTRIPPSSELRLIPQLQLWHSFCSGRVGTATDAGVLVGKQTETDRETGSPFQDCSTFCYSSIRPDPLDWQVIDPSVHRDFVKANNCAAWPPSLSPKGLHMRAGSRFRTAR